MKRFSENKTFLYLFVMCCFLFVFHIYQFIDSGFQVYPLIRIIGFFCIIISLLFFSEKVIPYIIYGFALAIAQTISFENYTPFIMVIIAYTMLKKHFPCMMVLYVFDIIVVCTRHGKSPIHLIIHVLNCAVLYLLIHMAMNVSMSKKRLDLTPDEDFILNEIVFNGKKLKEIDGYKQNTVSKKLKDIRIRNYCTTNQLLYERYKITKSINNQ